MLFDTLDPFDLYDLEEYQRVQAAADAYDLAFGR